MNPTRLRMSARTAEQEGAMRQAISQAPGGDYLIKHLDDGPYYLATVANPDGVVHWQADAAMAGASRFEVPGPSTDLARGEVSKVAVVVLPRFAFEIARWYSGNDGEIAIEDDTTAGPYIELPTLEQLARNFACLLDPYGSSRLGDVLAAHCELADTSMPGILTKLAESARTNDELADIIEALLAVETQAAQPAIGR